MSQYWWGDDENQRRMHWFTWGKLCLPKNRGVMGFRDTHSFNLAMLTKQCWRLIENYDSLYARVLISRYYPSGDILNCELKKGSSYVWQSIWAGIQTFKKGSIWRVGDGAKINIWGDCWIPNSSSRKIVTVRANQVLTRVHELIDPVSGEWMNCLFVRISGLLMWTAFFKSQYLIRRWKST